jgi:hypothetical protein
MRHPSWIVRRPLLAYFALAFLGTWLIVVPTALGEGEHGPGLLSFTVPNGADFLLIQCSAYTGPLLAAVLVAAATGGSEEQRPLRRRILRWRVGGPFAATSFTAFMLTAVATTFLGFNRTGAVSCWRSCSMLRATRRAG